MPKHALLSASGAHRWMACTPAAQIEAKLPSTFSEYAAEGTVAHSLADATLHRFKDTLSEINFQKELKRIQKLKFWSDDMPKEVEKYTTFVRECYNSGKVHAFEIEKRVNFAHLVPEGFGTADVILIVDHVMYVIDLKYGVGVPVSAENNEQGSLYALGALRKYDIAYDIQEVRICIVQPRLNSISIWSQTPEQLREWGEKVVRPKALQAYEGKGEFNPGEKQCKFCRAKPFCRALSNHISELAAKDFAEPDTLSDAEIIRNYESLDLYADWAKSVKDYVLSEALKGKKWQGYKLVEGTSRRRWKDKEAAIKALSSEYNPEEYLDTELKGLSKLEKMMSKGIFELLVAPHLEIPRGGPVLARESDRRPDFPKKDFESLFGKNLDLSEE